MPQDRADERVQGAELATRSLERPGQAATRPRPKGKPILNPE